MTTLHRRALFTRFFSAIGLATITVWISRCGTKSTGGAGGDLTITSSSSGGHTHQFTITEDELSSPPAIGLSREDSSSGGHTHTVVLSKTELESIAAGETVAEISGNSGGHTHTYTFKIS